MDTQIYTDDLKRYFALAWHWAWLLILFSILGAASAYFFSQRITPVYQASTLAMVNAPPSANILDIANTQTAERLAQTYIKTMTTRPILEGVVQRLGISLSPDKLRSMITAKSLSGTQLIQITVEDTDPQRAADIANALVVEFADQNQGEQAARYAASKNSLQTQLAQLDQQIQAATDSLSKLADVPENQAERDRLEGNQAQYRQIYATLLQSFEQVRLAEAQSTASLVQKDPAVAPGSPIRPQVLRNTSLGAMTGLILAGAIAFLIEYLDDTLRTPEDITRLFGLPVLGFIAQFDSKGGELVVEKQPRSPVSEAFRALRTNLQFSSIDRPLRSLLVTSPMPAEGKSTIAANLAAAMAQGGCRTTLADTDLRRPRVHRLFGLPNRGGITNLFVASQSVPAGKIGLNGSQQSTSIPNLQAITSGTLPPNPSELLASQRMVAILDQIQDGSEMIVLDSPPVLAVTDAAILASRVDGVLLVVKPGLTKLAACRQAVEQLHRVGANLLGVVFNGVELKRSRYNYYYKSYYTSYYHYNEAPKKPKAKSNLAKLTDPDTSHNHNPSAG